MYVLSYGDFLRTLVNESRVQHFNSNRFLDYSLSLNEDNDLYFSKDEAYKDELDEFIVKKILEYVQLDEVNENFFGSIVSKAREIGGNAVNKAKDIIKNIANLIKQIAEYIKVGWKKVAEYGGKLGDKLKDEFIQKLKKDKEDSINKSIKKHNLDPKGVKKDITDLKAHAEFLTSGDWIGIVKNKAGDAFTELKQNYKEGEVDKEEQEKALAALDKEEEKPGEEHKHESLEFYKALIYLIKEDRELIDLMSHELNEEEKESVSLKIGNILSILTSGVVKYFEEMTFKGLRSGIKGITGLIEKHLKGPDATELPMISFIAAFCIAFMIEFFLEEIGEKLEVEALVKISSMAHKTSGFYWASKGLDALLPGAKTIAKFVCMFVVLYLSIEHFAHLSHGGHEEHGKEHGEEKGNKEEKHKEKSDKEKDLEDEFEV